ncbi:RNA-dependent RNA polymerase 1-like protein [Dinothrombium tinctorium]|uniref:RNA-dependent RNA polymerase n=1 Tax=Dinothrombium tinctorium TaxID=1965070 RepID=A0A443R1K9_9ACAR|nr:RNA-dependent RNA polymerase 1-like protein [Dinothrombium tinctorium]
MQHLEAQIVCLASHLIEERFQNCETRVKQHLEDVFRRCSADGIELRSIASHKSILYRDELLFEFDAKLYFRRLTTPLIRDMIAKLCENSMFQNIYLNPGLDFYELSMFSLGDKKCCQQVKASSISFGTIVDLSNFISHFEYRNVCKESIFVRFEHDISVVNIFFCMQLNFSRVRYKLSLDYAGIKAIVCSVSKRGAFGVYLFLKYPPKIFAFLKDLDLQKSDKGEDHIHEAHGTWVRYLQLPNFNEEIFGKCSVLKLQLSVVEDEINEAALHGFECPWSLINNWPHYNDIELYFGFIQDHFSNETNPITVRLNANEDEEFNIVYSIKCLQSHTLQLDDELRFKKQNTQFRKKISEYYQQNPEILEYTLSCIYNEMQTKFIVRIMQCLTSIFEAEKIADRKKRHESDNTVQVRTLVFTPTRILLQPKLYFKQTLFCRKPPEGSNAEDTSYRAEYAIRAVIRDDDGNELRLKCETNAERRNTSNRHFNMRNNYDENANLQNLIAKTQRRLIDSCFKMRLLEGVKIWNRLYEYLGCSMSQLKKHGFYLYAVDKYGQKASDIIQSFGEIHEKAVGKFVAKIGLAFSEVERFVDVSEAMIEYIKDEEMEYNHEVYGKKKYNFTDGIGMVSENIAEKIQRELKNTSLLFSVDRVPSAFQIRIGGCKGMLVVNPLLPNNTIKIRRSMRKFESNDMNLLGILKVSSVRAAYLNRPLITLLEQLKADESYISKLLSEHLSDFAEALLTEAKCKEVLLNFSNIHHNVKVSSLFSSGVSFLDEPFFRLCIETITKNHIKQLKDKMRIKISRNKGRTMFGVVDETGQLEYGQVFVRYTNAETKEVEDPLKGTVFITKFPCIHPGDIRLFEAVDIKELHHIVDCVVFPKKGPRPHPDEMAGSDLDGDEYAVIWDTNLFHEKNYKPMDYTSDKPKEINGRIELHHILDFIVNYIQNYSVGQIANMHLAFADQLEDGVFSSMCQILAKKYTTSLDFPKTGINEKLENYEIVQDFPDFMEKEETKSFYISHRLLGRLYRKTKFVEMGMGDDIAHGICKDNSEMLKHNDWETFKESAENAYKNYRDLMKELETQFGVQSETSIFLGFIDKSENHFVDSEASNELKYRIQELVRNVCRTIRNDFEAEFKDDDQEYLKLAKASAYYLITKEMNAKSDQKYYGLPWIVSTYLAKLAEQNKGQLPSNKEDFLPRICHEINEFLGIDPQTCTFDDAINLGGNILKDWLKSQSTACKLGCSENILRDEILTAYDKETVSNRLRYEAPSVGDIFINILRKFASVVLYPHKCSDLAKNALANAMKEPNLKCEKLICPLWLKSNPKLEKYVTQNEREFKKELRSVSNVEFVDGRWIEKNNTFYYLLVAFGCKSSLTVLKAVIATILATSNMDNRVFHQ